MKKLEHTKPFNLEHAKAGAPYCVHDGQEASIFKWDARYPGYPLLGIYGPKDNAMGWNADGVASYGARFNLVMTPLGFIEGKPVFVGDELAHRDGGYFQAKPTWHKGWLPEQWRWPAPAKVYPETLMTAAELASNRDSSLPIGTVISESYEREARAIANAAIRHAIDAGQVVLPGEGDDVKASLLQEWLDKTEWVQDMAATVEFNAAGMHRADMMRMAYDGVKGAHDQCSRDLGKAEQLLEAMGYQHKDGEWISRAGEERGWVAYVDGHSVYGTQKATAHVRNVVARRDVRDMAIAKAVQHNCAVLAGELPTKHTIQTAIKDHLHLNEIIAGVKS